MSNLLSQASLVMIPSGYKEDVVYSAIPTNGNGDLSFTRASNGTRVNSAGLVEVVAWNLVEQSGVFNVSPWAFVGGTTLTSGFSDVNGTLNAFRFQATSGSYKYGYQTISSTIGQVYTHSIYAKCSSGTQQLKLTDAQQGGGSLQTVTTEWQRFTFTLTASGGNIAIELGSDGTNSLDVYICFAQTNIGATAKPYFPTTDRLNVPRLTYQNGGGGCPSLLLEKQSTNLVTYSEDFTNAVYTKVEVTASTNATTSPDGTVNGNSIFETTVSSTHESWQRASMTSGQLYTQSCFLKANGRNRVVMQIFDNATQYASAIYDLSTGVVVASVGTATIQSMGNGWYRCTITGTSPATGLGYCVLGLCENTYTNSAVMPSYAGDTAKGVYWWGFQVENSSYPTSYIPTTSSSATRVADNASRNGLALTNFTFAVNFKPLDYGVELFDFQKTVGGRMFYVAVQSNGFITFNGVSGGTIGGIGSIIPKLQTCKLAFSLNASTSDLKIYINGSIIGTYTTNITTFGDFLGLQSFGYNPGTQIEQIAIFPSVLTDAECQSLTTI